MQAKARWQGNLMCSISSAHRDVIVNFLCVCCFIVYTKYSIFTSTSLMLNNSGLTPTHRCGNHVYLESAQCERAEFLFVLEILMFCSFISFNIMPANSHRHEMVRSEYVRIMHQLG